MFYFYHIIDNLILWFRTHGALCFIHRLLSKCCGRGSYFFLLLIYFLYNNSGDNKNQSDYCGYQNFFLQDKVNKYKCKKWGQVYQIADIRCGWRMFKGF